MRDENRWYDSVAETIYPASFLLPRWLEVLLPPPVARLNRMVVASVWDGVFGGRFEERDRSLSIYRKHNARVEAALGPERLLVFEARQGWEPLCRFLEVPVPDTAYPHLNDASQIRRMIVAAKVAGWTLLALPVVALAAGWMLFSS